MLISQTTPIESTRKTRCPKFSIFQGGRNICQSTILQSRHDLHQGASWPGLPPLRRHGVRCRATARQRNHVAQEMLQLCRMPPTVGLDASLRRARQGNPLPILLQQTLWTQRIRIRTHPDSRLHERRSGSFLVSKPDSNSKDLSVKLRFELDLVYLHTKEFENSGLNRCTYK